MQEDVVTRLRTTLAHADDVYDTMNQAADEIERLQAELVRVLKPKDIWHDCSHCQGHEPDNG